ncbi:ATP-binding protein [Streptomyces sp. V4-01]|uniref:ATP-binding protein n=1 Tax=Actinacidiphila polyblastidii TaxID=3110430 RepID=A0ABU7PDW0_9ACTN|nr:ATP-binding protein [Streptomyces sp. V4-01]
MTTHRSTSTVGRWQWPSQRWLGEDRVVQVSQEFRGETVDIGAARRLVEDLFARLLGKGVEVAARIVADVQLVVSELVTNAVKYTAGPFGVALLASDAVVEITVWDTSTDAVAAMSSDPTRVGRHGLEIVTALCGELTITATSAGKQITAQMSLHTTAA